MLLDLTDSDHGALAALGRFLDQPHVPLVAFTAAQDLLSGIAALEAGADDLLSATMPAAELIARVRAVLRRQRGVRAPQPEAVLTGGPVVLDTGRRRVEVNGEQVFLTALEFNLLSYFLTHPGQAISRECLLESVWGYSVGGTATVTVHVRRIREKIEENPADPMLIRTVWGIGYRFSPGGP